MANGIVNAGNNLAMDIVRTYRPKFWQKKDYNNLQYYQIDVHYNSTEFREISEDVEDAQDEWGTDYNDDIEAIERIQNPYTYARFMLRKKELDMRNEEVYEFRKFKYIDKANIDSALKYNCDGRRFGNDSCNHRFYSTVPNFKDGHALLIVKVLSGDESDEDETIDCETDSEFYIEYVVYFD